jgi:parallel beta-helix repeat protein
LAYDSSVDLATPGTPVAEFWGSADVSGVIIQNPPPPPPPNDTTPPTVTNVTISGSSSPDPAHSFASYDGSGAQLLPAPVQGADTITVTFSEYVYVGINDLKLIGTQPGNIDTPTIAQFTHNGNSATWVFDEPLLPDQYRIVLDDLISDPSFNWLDGEWDNPTAVNDSSSDTFPSGNGTEGGDFEFDFATAILVSTEQDEQDTNYTVGDVSLREALLLASDANHPGTDNIVFLPTVNEILMTDGQFTIASGNNVKILGHGAETLTINAQGNSRVFEIANGATATLSDIRITGGSAAGGGGIRSAGALTIIRVQIDGNTATGSTNGGGIHQDAGAGTSLTIIDSTIASNAAFVGGGVSSGAPTTIKNSTVSSNTAPRGGGGIYLYGAGGQIINSTVTNNTNGGVYGTQTLMYNTIVSGNLGGSNDLTSTFHSNSANNLIGKDPNLTNGINHGNNNNQVGGENGAPAINALLGSLADNDGPTKTHALLVGSPAIDKGNNSIAAGLSYDQRGSGFPRIINGGIGVIVDVGAFEYHPSGSGSGAMVLSAKLQHSLSRRLRIPTNPMNAEDRARVLDRAFAEVRPSRRLPFNDESIDQLLLAGLNTVRESRELEPGAFALRHGDEKGGEISEANFDELSNERSEHVSMV